MDNCTINFGSSVRTILYEDSYGKLTFSFDIGPDDGKFLVNLYPAPKSIITSEQMRNDVAYKKVKDFLLSRGYNVKNNE